MGKWQDRLELIKQGQAVKPRVVELMRLPDLQSWKPGEVVTTWTVDPDFFTVGGQLYGGYMCALADQVLGHAALTVLGDDQYIRTAGINMSYYKPIRFGEVTITGRVVHQGSKAIFVTADFTNGNDLQYAAASGTQIVINEVGGERQSSIDVGVK